MAIWKDTKVRQKALTNNFGDGINVGVPAFDIKENELTYVRNMGSQDYPALATRYDRTLYSTSMPSLTNPNGIGERNNSQFHVLNDIYWKYWNETSTSFTTLSSSLTNAPGKILDFNTGSIRYSLMMNGAQRLYWDGASTSSTAYTLGDANTPLTPIFAVHKGRIYAGSGATLYYSALNNINDWTSANDAGRVTIARAKGSITGICEYNDKIIVYTQYSMHELYGTAPSNYELVDVEGEIGCISHKSIVKANKRLYFAWIDGIYDYNGGTPKKISQAVDDYIKGITYGFKHLIAAGSRGDYIYFAIPYGNSTNNLILVFDTRISRWFVETGNITDFATVGNGIYGLDSTGGIINMRDTNTGKDKGVSMSWDFITKPYIAGTGKNGQTLFDMSVLYKGSSDATMTVSYSTHATDNNSTSFNTIAQTSDFTFDSVDRVERIILPTTVLQNESYYRLRFTGTDNVTVSRLERNYRVKRR